MKPDKLMDAIGQLDDDLIASAEAGRQPRRDRRQWMRWTAVAACLCVVAGTVLLWPGFDRQSGMAPDGMGVSDTEEDFDGLLDETDDLLTDKDDAANTVVVTDAVSLAKAQYPELEQYDNGTNDKWWSNRHEQNKMGEDYAEGMERFYQATMEQFLVGKPGENRVYSPLNMYMALSMLAETVDGSSRSQILSLLGRKNMAAVRAAAHGLWNANYQDDGLVTSILGNSLWMANGRSYQQDTLDVLAQKYYASSFSGEMGSAAYNAAIQNWLNEQTGGLLKEQVSSVETDPGTVLALFSTIYFKATWMDLFDEKKTKPDTFHGADGDVTCDFMHEQNPLCVVNFGDGYKAINRGLGFDQRMWLLLPDEGVSVNDMIQNGKIPEKLAQWSPFDNHNPDYYDVTLSLPKFDVTANTDLKTGLQKLGITDIFDGAKADFAPILTQPKGVYLTDISHAARVRIDENGCEAAAYTMALNGMGAPQIKGKIDFNLNRPFAFFITGLDGVMLFAGVVENP